MLARTNKLPLALLLAAVALPAWAQGDTPALESVTLEHRRGGDLGLHSVTLEHRRGGDLGLHSVTLEHRRGGDLGLHSVTLEYSLPPVTASLGAANPAGRRLDSPSANDAVMQLRVKRNGGSGDLTLEAFRLVNAGTLDTGATPVDVRLVRDDDADGQAGGGEPTIASGSFDASGTAVFGAMTLTLAPSQTVHVLIVVDFRQPVPGDATFVPRAESMSFAQASGPAIAAAGLPLSGQVFTLGRADGDPPTISIDAPTEGEGFVNAATLTPVFSADDGAGGSGVASVVGVIDGTTPVRSGVPVLVSGLPLGTHVLTITARDNAGNVAVSGTTFYLERFTVLRGPADPAPARVPARAHGVTLLQLRLDRRGSPAAGMLGVVSLLASGSGDDSRLARVMLVRDLDSDGVAGAADPVLASGRFPSDEGALVLSGFSSPLPANGSADFVVACDLSGEERYGDTFAVTLTHAVAGIQAQVVEPLGLPLGGRTIIVEDVTAPVVDIQSPPDGSSLPDVGALTLSFTAQDEPRGSGLATLLANLDGASVVNAQTLELGTLSVGEHRLTVVATDVAGNRATEVSVFQTVTPQQALQDAAGGVQGVIDDAATPAAAKPLLQDALDLLVGSNGGRSGNGAVTLMNNGDVVAAMVKIQQAIRKLRQAADRGAATQELQEKLAEFLGQTMAARVAHLEQLVAADPNVDPAGKMPQIRSFMSQGDSAFAVGNYDSAVLDYRQAEQRVLELDLEVPVVTFVEPAGLATNDTTPRIRVQYIDLLGLIRTAGVRIFLDGTEQTGIAQIGPFQVILDVPDSLALSEGAHLVRIQVPDSAGNVADVTGTLLVDVTPPAVAFDSPAAFALLRNGAFLLQARYADNLSGVDTRTEQVLVNGVDLTAFAQVSESGVQLNVQGNLALPDGPASTEVSVRDRAGNIGSASLQFLVDSAASVVTIMPRSFTTITAFPVTFSVDVQDSGSGLLDAPAAIQFNGTDITGRFSAQVLSRVQVLNEMNVAREVVLTYTPSADEFTALVRASGIGVLFMEVNAQDRAQNGTRVQGYYEVNLSGGSGGGGEIPPIIVLRDARTPQIPPPPLPVTNRCGPALDFKVRALDIARGQAPVPNVALDFENPEGWGQFVHSKELGSLSTITDANGLAGSGMIAGSTPGVHPVTVSVSGDPSVTTLQFIAEATEPSLDPISDRLEVEPGSANGGIFVQARTNAVSPSAALVNETVRIVMVDASGQETPVDESKFLIMPAEELTTGGGWARFELVALSGTQPGPYNFRARLSEWNISTDFPIRVLDPRAHVTPLPTLPDGSVTNRNIYLAVVSGNAQIGVHDATLQRDLVVQLMKDGAASRPISESYPRFSYGNRVFPDAEMHIRKVRFAVSPGSATLSQPDPSLPGFSEVDLDASGQASVTLTCGPTTAAIEVSAYFIEEAGLPPSLQEEVPDRNAAPVFAVGTPEVRLERKTTSGDFVPAPAVFMAGPDYAWQYRWALRLPAGDSRGTVPGRVVSRDACGDDLALDLTRPHPVTTVLDLTPTQTQPAPDRYKQYATPEWAAVSDRSGERAKTSFPTIDPLPDTGEPTLSEPPPDPGPTPIPTVCADDAGWLALRLALSDEKDYVKERGFEPLAFMDVTVRGQNVTQVSLLKSADFTMLDAGHPLAVRVILPAVQLPIPVRISLSGASVDIPPLPEGEAPWTPSLDTTELDEFHRTFTSADLQALGLLTRSDADVQNSICIHDMVANFTDPNPPHHVYSGSNWVDGDLVDHWAGLNGIKVAGHARSQLTDDRKYVTTPSVLGKPYFAARSKFIKSAGVALLSIQAPDHLLGPVTGGVSWQASIFYYSGHGGHDTRHFWLVAGDDPTVDIDTLAKDTNWNHGLNLAVIAGCSLVDIVHPQTLPDPTVAIDNRAPGKALIAAGASIIVGYDWRAPLDDQYGSKYYSATIATDFLTRYLALRAGARLHDAPIAWVSANIETQDNFFYTDHGNMNSRGRAYDACGAYAVPGDEANWYYYYTDWPTGTQKVAPPNQWPP